VFWSSKSSSKLSGVAEESNPNFFQVLGFTPTLGQSRVATKIFAKNNHLIPILSTQQSLLNFKGFENENTINLGQVL
jgi:hypothetical protein